MAIKLFNVNNEEYFGDNVYLIHRPYTLSNPYTHIKDKQTKAMFVVSSREEAIEIIMEDSNSKWSARLASEFAQVMKEDLV